jgi:hypothetical protein
MAKIYESLNEALNECPSIYAYAHCYPERIHYETNNSLVRVSDSVANDTAVELDEHTIEHGLTKKELRTLFKILAKQLPNCGRKRGAILRYIKAYTTEDNNDNLKLYRLLNNET